MTEFDLHQKFRNFYLPRSPSNVINGEPDTREVSDDVQLVYAKLFGMLAGQANEVTVFNEGSLKTAASAGNFIPFLFTDTINPAASKTYIVPAPYFTAIALLSTNAQPIAVNVTFDGTTFSTLPPNTDASIAASASLIANVRGYQLTNNNVGVATIQLMGVYR